MVSLRKPPPLSRTHPSTRTLNNDLVWPLARVAVGHDPWSFLLHWWDDWFSFRCSDSPPGTQVWDRLGLPRNALVAQSETMEGHQGSGWESRSSPVRSIAVVHDRGLLTDYTTQTSMSSQGISLSASVDHNFIRANMCALYSDPTCSYSP